MIKNLLGDDEPSPEAETAMETPRVEAGSDPTRPDPTSYNSSVITLFDPHHDPSREKPAENFVISSSEPQSADETMRQSGLAYSAGIAFFAAVVFMLILGWGADVLLGSSPWGIVGGIVIGSIIGFIQFFRITSQIFKK